MDTALRLDASWGDYLLVALCPSDRADSIAAAVEDATRSGGFPVPTSYATSAQDGARQVQLHL